MDAVETCRLLSFLDQRADGCRPYDTIEIVDAERVIARQMLGFTPTLATVEQFQSGRTCDAIILRSVID
jgi:hypothetical protein